ncbi:MAG TPA: hypothetical protein VFK33_12410 [Bacillales bacterium]|nr:hypothetical protein [Bacillales bacterium]
MNLFENYKPIKPNDNKKSDLSKKITKSIKASSKRRSSSFKTQLAVVAAAVLLFVMALNYFSNHNPKTGNTSVSNPQSSNTNHTNQPAQGVVKHITYEGESKHWKAVNKVFIRKYAFDPKGKYVGKTFKVGAFRLAYKGTPPKQNKGKISFNVKGNGSTSGKGVRFPKNGVLLSNGHVYGETEQSVIRVTVNWKGRHETFKMTSQPKAFQKKTLTNVPSLSKVKKMGRDNPFLGETISKPFQIASGGWGKLDYFFGQNHRVPAYLSTEGKNAAQTVFLLFPDLKPTDKVIVVGTHKGEQRTLFSGIKQGADCPYLVDRIHGNCKALVHQIKGKDFVPAVLELGHPGFWNLTAYVNKKKMGEVKIYAYQKPTLPDGSETHPSAGKMQGITIKKMYATFTAQWTKKNGRKYLFSGAPMEIKVTPLKINKKPLAHPFPIFVVGTPLSGDGKPFIQAFERSDVKKKGGRYFLKTNLPVRGSGKWKVTVYEGEAAISGVNFYVR